MLTQVCFVGARTRAASYVSDVAVDLMESGLGGVGSAVSSVGSALATGFYGGIQGVNTPYRLTNF